MSRAASLSDTAPPKGGRAVYPGFWLLGDLRNQWRVMKRRGMTAVWREPTETDRRLYESHPVFDHYAEFLVAVAAVATETWLLFERAWAGWPDPPTYAVFHLSAAGDVVAATDTYTLPSVWRMPTGFKAS